MIRVSILGATGYTGGELLRILFNHPGVQIQHVTSESHAGEPLSAVHPAFRNRSSLSFEKMNLARIAADSDVAFLCFPAGVGIRPARALLKAGVKVVDLSADFRLPTAALYKSWYKGTHAAPGLLKTAVYGLPELFRDGVASAALVANPGCYATAALLALAPLVRPLAIDPRSVIVDAKSGVSGAGKKLAANYLFGEVNENFQAYGVASHRHQPEMEHALGRFGRLSPRITFTPHLVPMTRGILAVAYATMKSNLSAARLRERYERFYASSPFVRVLPDGVLPQTRAVSYTNACDISVRVDARSRRAIVLAAIDNLMKGASGQAVQNMNLMFGRPETEGLR